MIPLPTFQSRSSKPLRESRPPNQLPEGPTFNFLASGACISRWDLLLGEARRLTPISSYFREGMKRKRNRKCVS